MTLHHLEIFRAVCRTMSMTKAAEQLNMSQPAVSKAIAELEAFYHSRLFDRIRKQLYLTDRGKLLLQYADTILSQYEQSQSSLREGTVFQTCRLAVNVTAGETILDDLCALLREKIAGIVLSVTVSNSRIIEEMLKNNECDFAIMDETEDSSLHTKRLYQDRLVPVCASSYCDKKKLKRDELKDYRLLLREKGSGNRASLEAFLKDIQYPENNIWTSASDEVLLNLAMGGEGIAFLPESYLKKKAIGSANLPEIEKHQFVRSMFVVTLADKYLNTTVKESISLIEEYCRSHLRYTWF